MPWYVSHNGAFNCFMRVALVICAIIFAFSLHGASPLAAQGPAPQDGFSMIIEADPTDTPPLPSTGLRPFLFNKPFTETYATQYQLRSFFDHKLPLMTREASANIPADLRDGNQSITNIFTGESRPNDNNQGYSWYSGHNGLDYGLNYDPVLAPANGTIAYVSSCAVVIEHDASELPDGVPDYSTLYIHLDSVDNAPETQRSRPGRKCGLSATWCEGDSIAKGDTIGLSGNDRCGGDSTGAHLHFGVNVGQISRSWDNP